MSGDIEHRGRTGHIDRDAVSDRTVLLLALLWVLAAIPVTSLTTRLSRAPLERAAATLDPNDARWWELAAIPRIGEALARRITKRTARTDGQAVPARTLFYSPDDLQRVRGIGPKTAGRVAPFLHFPPPVRSTIAKAAVSTAGTNR